MGFSKIYFAEYRALQEEYEAENREEWFSDYNCERRAEEDRRERAEEKAEDERQYKQKKAAIHRQIKVLSERLRA